MTKQKFTLNQSPKTILDLTKQIQKRCSGRGGVGGRGRGRGGKYKNINLLTQQPKVVKKQKII